MKFPKDFKWGVATASYQVEGAAQVDGRGESIWDDFCRQPGRVYGGHNGTVACDQYHRYKEDIKLMSYINIGTYRFSIAWPRIMPTGEGPINHKGLDYYKRLCEALLHDNIAPAATLYHWDLPLALHHKGGWLNRDTALRFRDYAVWCFKELGEYIPMWLTLNEPICVAELGYAWGMHAPGHTSVAEGATALHHLNLAHGLAVEGYRHSGNKGQIGTVLNLGVARPATARPEDREVADIANDGSRMYLHPIYGKGYPERRLKLLESRGITLPIKAGDLEQIAQPIDFLGFNYYFELPIVHREVRENPPPPANEDGFSRIFTPYIRDMSWESTTAMGWAVVPHGIYRHLQWIKNEVGNVPIYITENGCAQEDHLTATGRVHDPQRIEYLRAHLKQLERAVADGINLKGYYLWSLIDNFEWAHGYTKRFGIVYCDYTNLARYPKDSYYFYRDVIAGYVE